MSEYKDLDLMMDPGGEIGNTPPWLLDNEERNQSAYVMPDKLSDLDTLLLKSERLIVEEQGDGNDKQ